MMNVNPHSAERQPCRWLPLLAASKLLDLRPAGVVALVRGHHPIAARVGGELHIAAASIARFLRRHSPWRAA